MKKYFFFGKLNEPVPESPLIVEPLLIDEDVVEYQKILRELERKIFQSFLPL